MRPRATLVELLLTGARTHELPRRPARPLVCPWCHSGDVHGARPCAQRPDLELDVTTYRHDWHCHACAWSARIGDA